MKIEVNQESWDDVTDAVLAVGRPGAELIVPESHIAKPIDPRRFPQQIA